MCTRGGGGRGGKHRKQQPRLNELKKPKKHTTKFYEKVKEKC